MMLRRVLPTIAIVAMFGMAQLAFAANVGELVGVDDDFWGASIGDVDNSAATTAPFGVFNGSLDMATVNGWLTAGGVHSFALIPPAPSYYGNSSLPVAGVPDVGIQELTLTLSDWSTVTVPLINGAYIKRGIAQGAGRDTYMEDMNFHDHESLDAVPANGGPRPVLYQVDLSAYQGNSVMLDPSLDLRASGFSEEGRTFDVYEVTEAYDYTDVTYGSLVFGGEIPELPPLAFNLLATQDAYLQSGVDVPDGVATQHCVTANPDQNKAVIYDFDIAASGAEGLEAVGDGVLRINVGWDEGEDSTVVAVWEVIGDEWDETTVTAVNYCLDGQVPNMLGDMAGTGIITEEGNFVYNDIPVAEATITKLLNGEISGLALSTPTGGWMNTCVRTTNTDWTLHATPQLIFSATQGGGEELPGDFNGDGVVSDADYTIWADNYGASGATFAMGDANGDGEVSDADYTIWADNYGATSAAVPEPTTMALVALGGLAMIRRKR
jgi:PEP-CTERM motif-containing protein/dockerin type I repeat protein